MSIHVNLSCNLSIFFLDLRLLFSRTLCRDLTLSYIYSIYVRNLKTVATPVRIYTYTDLSIEIWGFYRRLKDTLRYLQHELFTCFRSVASISQHVYQVGRKVEFSRSCPLFWASFGKLRLSNQVQFIAWHGIQRRIIWIFCRESEVSG